MPPEMSHDASARDVPRNEGKGGPSTKVSGDKGSTTADEIEWERAGVSKGMVNG